MPNWSSKDAQKDVKIRVLATTIKPGQTVEEAVQEELRRAEEKQSLLAESASAREGTTPEEARRALELAELWVPSLRMPLMHNF